MPEAVALVRQQVEIDPCRVVGVRQLEGAVPHAGVAAALGVVVARHTDDAATDVVGARRNAAELLRIELDARQRGARIAQLGVDHLSDRLDPGGVGNARIGGVRRQAAHAHGPAALCRRQVDAVGALVGVRSLAVEGTAQRLGPGAAIGGQLDHIFHAIAGDVAVALVGLGQAGDRRAQAHGRQLGPADLPGPRGFRAQLHAHGGFALDAGEARDVVLILGSGALFERHTAVVQAAIGVLHRGFFEIDPAQAADDADDVALTEGVENLDLGQALQAVRRLDGRARLAAALAAAQGGEYGHGKLQAQKCRHKAGAGKAARLTAGLRRRCRRKSPRCRRCPRRRSAGRSCPARSR
ncbi:hypothetical protein D3C81_555000 [compost metagenome]